MALWGNNDNVGAAGTVLLNYSTGVVTGAGTSFGIAGGCSEGDVIRIGDRDGTYYGDAVIISIANSESLTIGSTIGLSGVAVAATTFQVSQLPKSSILDESFSETLAAAPTKTTLTFVATASTNVNIGTDFVPLNVPASAGLGLDLTEFVNANDFIINNSTDIVISSVGSTGVSLGSTIAAGISTGNEVQFKRFVDGYDKYAYGMGVTAVSNAAETSQYGVSHAGWVGVQTYIDNSGSLRVKSEVLVAQSGIQTGNTPLYPPS